jgi:hypothetical protein
MSLILVPVLVVLVATGIEEIVLWLDRRNDDRA